MKDYIIDNKDLLYNNEAVRLIHLIMNNSNRIDKIEMVKEVSKENLIKMVVEIETILKYIKSNGNIDLILDKFVIEMREYYG